MSHERKLHLVRQFDLTAQSMSLCLTSLDHHVEQLQVHRDAITRHLDAHITSTELPAVDLPSGVIAFQRATHFVYLADEDAQHFEQLVNRLHQALLGYAASYRRADQQHKVVHRLLTKLQRRPAHNEDVARRFPVLSELDDRMTAYRALGQRIGYFHAELQGHISAALNNRRGWCASLSLRLRAGLQRIINKMRGLLGSASQDSH